MYLHTPREIIHTIIPACDYFPGNAQLPLLIYNLISRKNYN